MTEDYKYLHDAPGLVQAKDKGLVRVPIDEAMRMTLPLLQADKPHAAYPIATRRWTAARRPRPTRGQARRPA